MRRSLTLAIRIDAAKANDCSLAGIRTVWITLLPGRFVEVYFLNNVVQLLKKHTTRFICMTVA